jgi:hypothetical protein
MSLERGDTIDAFFFAKFSIKLAECCKQWVFD